MRLESDAKFKQTTEHIEQRQSERKANGVQSILKFERAMSKTASLVHQHEGLLGTDQTNIFRKQKMVEKIAKRLFKTANSC